MNGISSRFGWSLQIFLSALRVVENGGVLGICFSCFMERTWHLRNWFNLFHFKLAIVRKSVPLHIASHRNQKHLGYAEYTSSWKTSYPSRFPHLWCVIHIHNYMKLIPSWEATRCSATQEFTVSLVLTIASLPSPDVHHSENIEVAVPFKSWCYLPWDITDTSGYRELCGNGHLRRMRTLTALPSGLWSSVGFMVWKHTSSLL